ncbi:MAG: class I SAM-dependent methyltransferase [Candidatus Competibacteraceae bacterium]|nr:class I SAM-dependent methyltransferase [Candidatus Competibacteraceae bacterium]
MSNKNNLNSDLVTRQESESNFHDRKYNQHNQGEQYPRHYAVNPTYPIYQRMLNGIDNLSNKRVLEHGCGEGWITGILAQRGAFVSAFDISSEAVCRTSELLALEGLADQCHISQMGAEQLDYPDQFFDIAVGFAIIHHLDLNLAIPELYRVLKPGGIAYFAEPLGNNPLINLYRRLTPQYRTKDEEPIDLKKLPSLLGQFKDFEHKEFYVIALSSIALAYLPFGKKLFPIINQKLMQIDDRLLGYFPSLGALAWYTILKIRK